MKLRSVFISFLIYYILTTFIVSSALVYFDISKVAALDVIILFGVIRFIGGTFAKRNGRYYSDIEQTKVIWGFIVINTLIQSLFVLSAFSSSDKAFSLSIFLIALSITSTLHSIGIYFFVKTTKKNLIKRGIIAR